MPNQDEGQMSRRHEDGVAFALVFRNCEGSISDTILTLKEALSRSKAIKVFEVWLVDDASTDNSLSRAQATIENAPELRNVTQTIVHPTHRGIGDAILNVAKHSKARHIIPVTGINNMTANGLAQLMQSCEADKMTIAYRSNLWATRPFFKALASRVLSRLLLPLFRFSYHEVTCNYVLLAEDVRDFVPERSGHGIMFYVLAGRELRRREIKEIWIEQRRDKGEYATRRLPALTNALEIVRALFHSRNYARAALEEKR